MNRTFHRRLTGLIFLLVSIPVLSYAADTKAGTNAWKTDLLAWRAQQAKNLQEPTGWLTLIGLEWLKPGDNSFGSAKENALVVKAPTAPSLGIVKLNGDSLQLLPPPGGY